MRAIAKRVKTSEASEDELALINPRVCIASITPCEHNSFTRASLSFPLSPSSTRAYLSPTFARISRSPMRVSQSLARCSLLEPCSSLVFPRSSSLRSQVSAIQYQTHKVEEKIKETTVAKNDYQSLETRRGLLQRWRVKLDELDQGTKVIQSRETDLVDEQQVSGGGGSKRERGRAASRTRRSEEKLAQSDRRTSDRLNTTGS